MITKSKNSMILSILVLVLLVVMLSACSKKKELIGTWIIESVDIDGVSISWDALVSNGMSEDQLIVVLKEDGIAVVTSDGNEMEGTYIQEDTLVTITINGISEEFTYADGKLSANDGEYTIFFVKE